MAEKMRALIIDDMPLARATLRQDIEAYCPTVDVIGEAEGVVSALKRIRAESPDLLFLDIELTDGSGFDLLELLEDKNCRIIFTTASNDHAIQAFRVAAIDYLLKPIDVVQLQQAVTKAAEDIGHHAAQVDVLRSNMASENVPDKLVLHTQEQISIVRISDIVRCEAMGNYTRFHLQAERPILVTRTLKEFEDVLRPCAFLRSHQSHLVNPGHIKAYIKTEGGYLLMSDQSRVPVAVRKKAFVLAALDNLS